ncbi:MAG: TIGR04282 family arsenosugar biosynthesis glycosyltransferase [Ignavibacteriales bacterium]|nr:TIGR04282 family arsenosugar biosynthesis glycosyltransferase [Ignavibacteriales bacterium]
MESLRKFVNDFEIIIADGGSTDNTLEICKREKAILIISGRGRGCQLNKGAKAASGEILLFLHADTLLPDDAFILLDEYFGKVENKICRFLLGFDVDHWLLDFYLSFSKYDSIFTRFGDSAIIVRKSLFEELGGFPNRSVFEDVEFFRKVTKNEKITILSSSVISSARRFMKNGVVKQQLINIYLFAYYFIGVSKNSITSIYNKKLKNIKKASLITFLRYPQLGKVKTRLAADTTKEFALHFYKECANKIIREIKKVSHVNKYVFYSDKEEKENVKNWLGKNFYYSFQDGNDLGQRMKNAFQKVFSHGAEKVIIMGTDIPDLSQEIIESAVNILTEVDIVIGPSKDGGYYLLGMKKMYNEFFEDIKFSTSKVLAETISIADKLNLQYSLLTQLNDIDTEKELKLWLETNSNTPIKKEIDFVYNLINGRIKQRCVHCGE